MDTYCHLKMLIVVRYTIIIQKKLTKTLHDATLQSQKSTPI